MSDGDDLSGPALYNSVADHLQTLPASQEASSPLRSGYFARDRSVHELLGSNQLADIVLWRKGHLSTAILVAATMIWIVFEWFDYRVLSLAAMGFLIALVVLFLWSNAAALMNRPPPPVANVQLSEETVIRAAATFRREINRFIMMLHEIALGKDIKLFLMIEFSLWLISVIGGWCNFLTLLYIGTVLVLTAPVFYEKYEDKIDSFVQSVLQEFRKLYDKIYETVTSKMRQGRAKEKKTQ